MRTDASGMGIGAVLEQMPDNESPEPTFQGRPISFFSRALSGAEKNWDTHERECFAMISGYKHFCYYLYNTKTRKFAITDHKPLIALMHATSLTGHLAQWQMILRESQLIPIH